MRDFSWDDIKLFLAVLDAGSVRGAAQRLHVSPATVSRRIDMLEARVGERLLDRRPDGLVVTARGAALAEAAASMRDAAERIVRATVPMEGPVTVRLTATRSVTVFLVAHLADLDLATPGVVISLLPSRSVLSLTRREADIALRMTSPEEGSYLVRRLVTQRSAIYAAASLLRPDGGADAAHLPIIGLDRADPRSRQCAAIEAWSGGRLPRIRIDDTQLRLEAACAGVGAALLPCVLGDAAPALRRIGDFGADLDEDIFLVMHEDLARTPPVRRVADALTALFARNRRAFLGEGR